MFRLWLICKIETKRNCTNVAFFNYAACIDCKIYESRVETAQANVEKNENRKSFLIKKASTIS